MLKPVCDYFKVSPDGIFRGMREMLTETEAILASKGVSYADLRTALVPQPHRREIALLFDALDMRELWYGRLIHEAIIPLFTKESNNTVLEGDYIEIGNIGQNLLFEMVKEGLLLTKDIVYRHSSQFYIVYINNLTDRMVETFHTRLSAFAHYAGYVDATLSSRFLRFDHPSRASAPSTTLLSWMRRRCVTPL
jgi:hypothetical protein